MNDEIKGLVERLNEAAGPPPVVDGVWMVPSEHSMLFRQAAAALTLSDEARVRAERERDEALRELSLQGDGPMLHIGTRRWEEHKRSLQASEALVRELVGVGRNVSFQASRLLAALRDGSVASDWQRAHSSMVLAREITAINALILRAEALVGRAEKLDHGDSATES